MGPQSNMTVRPACCESYVKGGWASLELAFPFGCFLILWSGPAIFLEIDSTLSIKIDALIFKQPTLLFHSNDISTNTDPTGRIDDSLPRDCA